jgi:hypothetical protein
LNLPKESAASSTESSIRQDIEDEQRIHVTQTQYANITFKHILLPGGDRVPVPRKIFGYLSTPGLGEVQIVRTARGK